MAGTIDTRGSCSHARSTVAIDNDAHQIVSKSLQSICQRAGYSFEIKNVPISEGQRRADLFIKHINLAGQRTGGHGGRRVGDL